jgi:hypothetical protein
MWNLVKDLLPRLVFNSSFIGQFESGFKVVDLFKHFHDIIILDEFIHVDFVKYGVNIFLENRDVLRKRLFKGFFVLLLRTFDPFFYIGQKTNGLHCFFEAFFIFLFNFESGIFFVFFKNPINLTEHVNLISHILK